MPEFDYYIPPDVPVNPNGSIDQANWDNVYRFDDELSQFLVSFTGMGMPPIKYIEQTGPEQHGSTPLGFRLQKRIIQYIHRRNGRCSRQSYWDARADIINLLRPNRQCADSFGTGRLRKVLPNGDIRDFRALIQRGPNFQATNPSRWDEWSFTETLRFTCFDPTAFDPERIDVEWSIETFDGLIFFEFTPESATHLTFPDNALFGTGVLSAATTITYTGTWFAYPEIHITGPVSNPTVENETLGTKISLNYIVPAGETVIITTEYGNKTIESATGTNLIGTLTDDSDLDFFIAPHPTALNGINEFSAYGVGGDVDQTQIEMKYFTRYIGI